MTRSMTTLTEIGCISAAWIAIALLSGTTWQAVRADGLQTAAHSDVRFTTGRLGGVIGESYHFERYGPPSRRHFVPAGAPHRYGFAAESHHRWGWFGAGRYFPTVLWHRGYNGDHYRWAYRHGY